MIGLQGSLVQLTRYGSIPLVGRTTDMPMLYQDGAPGLARLVACSERRGRGGGFPSTVITTTGSVIPFHAFGMESEPSKEPCVSYTNLDVAHRLGSCSA